MLIFRRFRRMMKSVFLSRRIRKHYHAGWDIVEYLLYANFEPFIEFYEEEFRRNEGIVDWGCDENHIHARKEMDALYVWWKWIREERHDRLDSLTDEVISLGWKFEYYKHKDGYFEFESAKDVPEKDRIARIWGRVYELEVSLWEEEQSMLKRLIDIRDFLWT